MKSTRVDPVFPYSINFPQLTIILTNTHSKLLNENRGPSLIVNDLKHAASPSEAMGRRFDASNESFFSGL